MLLYFHESDNTLLRLRWGISVGICELATGAFLGFLH